MSERLFHRSRRLLSILGPGLIVAGAAIGVSHLIQATRAGAEYGLALLGFVILACVFKYPFLEFGPRYAAATGETLLHGYKRLGQWAIGLFALVTLSTMMVVQAAMVLTTAGLVSVVFGLSIGLTELSVGVLLVCLLVLALGRYRGLDRTMKLMMAVLAVSTLIAVVLAFGQVDEWRVTLNPSSGWEAVWTLAGISFLLALLGWMPIPLEVAAWHSIWTIEHSRLRQQPLNVADSILDFRIGYIGATVMAVLFLLLGTLVLYGSEVSLPTGSVPFAATLVDIYTQSLGEWARALIATTAMVTMFSTTLAVTDAYPRALRTLMEVMDVAEQPNSSAEAAGLHRARYVTVLLLVVVGALAIIHYLGDQFTRLIDFAATVAFLSAPLLAWLNIRLLTSEHTPVAHRPGPKLMTLAWAGFAFLVVFSVMFVAWRLLA